MTFQWGCGNYSGFGDGGAWDNEGIGDNVPLEILHPCKSARDLSGGGGALVVELHPVRVLLRRSALDEHSVGCSQLHPTQ